jgi:hypothetical protein
VSPTYGAAWMPASRVEVEALVPTGYMHALGRSISGLGNVYLGASYVSLGGTVRVKTGGGLALPTARTSGDGVMAAYVPAIVDAYQQSYLRYSKTLGVVSITRIEGGHVLVPSLDVDVALLVATSQTGTRLVYDSVGVALTGAPGIGVRPVDPLLAGVRVPLALVSEGGDINGALSVEPFGRWQIGPGFVSARFTMPVLSRSGFAFETGGVWGLHVGGGAAF